MQLPIGAPPSPPPEPRAPTGVVSFVWALRNPPSDPKTSFVGKTVLITGCNTGLGLEAAVKYAALGASKLIIAVRTQAKGEATKKEIIKRTGIQDAAVKIMTVDLSTFDSVANFCREVEEADDVLDVALLNAGIAPVQQAYSPNGWEMTIQVNTLSTVLMAILLLPKLKKSAETSGRPVHLGITGSGSHEALKAGIFKDKKDNQTYLEVANQKTFFGVPKQYQTSKLYLMYCYLGIVELLKPRETTSSLAPNGNGTTLPPSARPPTPPPKDASTTALPQLPPSNLKIITTTCCPGSCQSSIYRNVPFPLRTLVVAGTKIVSRTSEQGARTLVSSTALGPEYAGCFWKHDEKAKFGVMIWDEDGENGAIGKTVWNEVLELLGGLGDGIGERVKGTIKEFSA